MEPAATEGVDLTIDIPEIGPAAVNKATTTITIYESDALATIQNWLARSLTAPAHRLFGYVHRDPYRHARAQSLVPDSR